MTSHTDIENKLMTPKEAVRKFIKDGAQVAIGGFTINRNPMGIVYEIIRQRRRNLHLVCHSNGQALDLLIGAGCVTKVEIAYGGNGRFAPTCIRFRKAIEDGKLAFEDYSNFHMSLRFLAGALGIPFIPTKSGLGTSLLRLQGFSREQRKARKTARKKCVTLQNPFNGKQDKVILLPALIKGLTFADIEQAKAADSVIVTCEEIVPRSVIRTDPDQNALPPFMVDAVVRMPYGAHPTACGYFYDYDPSHLNMYRRAAREDVMYRKYLKEWVHGVSSHEEYLDKVGTETLAKIKADPALGYAPGLDRR
jgi:glutaconate CoA-transferase subunit A